jgi:hypothetical protein
MVAERLIGGRGSAAFHERLVLQDAVGQPLQVDAFSKRDPVAWRVRIPSGQGLARHAHAGGGGAWPTSGQKRSRILFQASPCQTLGAMNRTSLPFRDQSNVGQLVKFTGLFSGGSTHLSWRQEKGSVCHCHYTANAPRGLRACAVQTWTSIN